MSAVILARSRLLELAARVAEAEAVDVLELRVVANLDHAAEHGHLPVPAPPPSTT